MITRGNQDNVRVNDIQRNVNAVLKNASALFFPSNQTNEWRIGYKLNMMFIGKWNFGLSLKISWNTIAVWRRRVFTALVLLISDLKGLFKKGYVTLLGGKAGFHRSITKLVIYLEIWLFLTIFCVMTGRRGCQKISKNTVTSYVKRHYRIQR